MRYGAGFYATDALPILEQTRQREIDEAWDELALATDDRDMLLALLRLKRYVREANSGRDH